MQVGFTGTRNGMTTLQTESMRVLLEFVRGDEQNEGWILRHGMCVGADEDCHNIARVLGYHIIGFPGVNKNGKCYTRANVVCDETRQEEPFVVRDKKIVDESSCLIACPKDFVEELRSGTWTTVRYATKIHKPVCIVWPDGELEIVTKEKDV